MRRQTTAALLLVALASFGRDAQAAPVVLDIFPTVDGDARDTGRDGTFETVDTGSVDLRSIINLVSGGTGYEERVLIEFDLSSVPLVPLISATFRAVSLGSGGPDPNLHGLYGYVGDGALSTSDANNTGNFLGSDNINCLPCPLLEQDVTSFIQPLIGPGSFAGFVIKKEDSSVAGSAIFFANERSFTIPARLRVVYDDSQLPLPGVPEPATLLLLATGLGVAACRRRRT